MSYFRKMNIAKGKVTYMSSVIEHLDGFVCRKSKLFLKEAILKVSWFIGRYIYRTDRSLRKKEVSLPKNVCLIMR